MDLAVVGLMIGCALSTMLCVVAGRWLWRVQRDRTQTWALGLGMLGVLLAALLAVVGLKGWNTLSVIAAVLVLQLVCLSVVLLWALRFGQRQADDLHAVRKELLQSRQRLQNASQNRGEFLARMSHALLTPLHGILGHTHQALAAQPNPKMAAYLRHIQQAGGELMEAVNAVHNFAVIDAGLWQLELGDFELHQVLKNAVQLVQERAHARGLKLHRELDRNLPRYVHGDALCIGQIVLNYLNNAIQFTEQGHIVVRVLNQGAVVGQNDGVRLRFEVSDTGVGLTPAQMERLFSTCKCVEGAHHRRVDGAGLGLATARQLAQMMGGEVGVQSQVGLGSTFWLELPLRQVDMPTGAVRPGRVPSHADGLTGLQILVVDDSLFNLEVTRDALEQAGALVMTATDGEQALGIMRTVAFDCVLMDLQMPHLDGLAATRLIRQDSALASTLVIGLTAHSYREHRAACLDAGMHTVLTKATEPAQLVATILDFLERLGRLRDRAPPVAPQAPAEWLPGELEKFVGTNMATQQRLLGRYLTEGERLCAVMATQQQSADWHGVGESAHSLKSSSKAVGAMPLAQRCQELEEAGRTNDEVACQRLLPEVQAGFLRVQALIQARLQAPPAAPG